MAVAVIDVTQKRAVFVNQDFSALLAEASTPIIDFVEIVSSCWVEKPIISNDFSRKIALRLKATAGAIGERFHSLSYRHMGSDQGSECYLVTEGQDHSLFAALEPRSISQAYLALALQSSGIGAWSLDVMTQKADRTLNHDRIFGYQDGTPHWDLDVFLSHVIEDDRQRVHDAFAQAVSNQDPWKFECRIRRLDGELRWIEASGYPRGGGDIAATHFIGLVKDITADVNAAEQRRLLFAELHHRVRNNLAVVQSLAMSTFRMATDTTAAAKSLQRRISALSDAHNLLLEASEGPITIKQAVENVLNKVLPRPLVDAIGNDGALPLSFVVPLSMWLMELLSRLPFGNRATIEVDWQGETISLLWKTEQSGDASWADELSKPLILNILPAQLSAQAIISEDDEGFSALLTMRPPSILPHVPSRQSLSATTMLI